MVEPLADLYLRPSRPPTPRGFTALVVAVAGLLMAGTVSVVAMGAQASTSPESAVTGFLTALGSGNVTGALNRVDPAEADAIAPSLGSIVGKLKSLGVLDSGADLGAVSGISATFDNVTLSTEQLRPGLDAVTITGGTATLKFDPAALPVGALVKGLLGSVSPITKSFTLGGDPTSKHPIAVVERDGQWYVSFGYTLAESLRRAGGETFPAASAPAAVGSASPEALVSDLIAAVSKRDVAGVIGLVDPGNGGPLYDYAPLLQGALDHAPALSVATVTGVRDVEGGKLVTVSGLSVAGHQIDLAGLPVDLSNAGIVAVQATASNGQTRWFLDPYRTAFDDLASVVDGLTVQDLSKLSGLFGSK